MRATPAETTPLKSIISVAGGEVHISSSEHCLVLGTGPGFGIRQPLGHAIIGTLMVSGVPPPLHHAGELSLHGLARQVAGTRAEPAEHVPQKLEDFCDQNMAPAY